MVQTYQLGTTGSYGTSLKIAPVTTESEENARTCLQVNGTSGYSITPQSILPSLLNFECAGQETIDGILTEKWQLTETVGNKLNKYSLWMFYREDPDSPAKIAVPVR